MLIFYKNKNNNMKIFLKANFYLTGENKKVVEWTNLQPRNAKVEFSYAITAAPLCLRVMTM